MRRRDEALLRLLAFEYDECSLCGVTYPLHLHHVILRSQAGDDVRQNIVCLCLYCHESYHRARGDARHRLALHVRENRPDVVAYIDEKLVGGAAQWFAVHIPGYTDDQ